MDRRSFFRESLRSTGETVVKHADSQASKKAEHWIRPPYALDELEFLLTCTRCGECVAACPHDTVFLLSARLGAQVAGSPALDLLNTGCHLCTDWPCVTACEPAALRLPDQDGVHLPRPRLASAVVNSRACLPYTGPECGACANSCPVPDAMTWEREKPRIDARHCVGCGLCRADCIITPAAIDIVSLHRQQGSDAPNTR